MEELNSMMHSILISAQKKTPLEYLQGLNHDENSDTFTFDVGQLNEIYDYYVDYYKPHHEGPGTARAFKVMRQQMRDDINLTASNAMKSALTLYEHFFDIIVKFVKNDWSKIKAMKNQIKLYKIRQDPTYSRRIPTDFELVQYMVMMDQFEEDGAFYTLVHANN